MSSFPATSEVVPLTVESISELFAQRRGQVCDSGAANRRRSARWPFPGTVQLWLPGANGQEEQAFATCLNMSFEGLGMLSDEALPVGRTLAIAVHQPEMSLQGRGVVRHCTALEAGYYVGLQFDFSDQS